MKRPSSSSKTCLASDASCRSSDASQLPQNESTQQEEAFRLISDLEYEEEERNGQNKKRTTLPILNLVPSLPQYNNETLADFLCSQIASTVYGAVEIYSSVPPGVYYTMPACFAGPDGASITRFEATNLFIPSFDVLPPSTSSLTIQASYLAPNDTAPMSSPSDGYDDLGNLDWNEIWSLFPNMTRLQLGSLKHVQGSLPASLPSALENFFLTQCNFTGTIPTSFLSNYSGVSFLPSLTITLSYLEITGTFENGFFLPLSSMQVEEKFRFEFVNNLVFTGSIPVGFLTPLENLNAKSFRLIFDSTPISGTLPSDFAFPANLLNASSSSNMFHFSATHSDLSGPLPTNLFGNGLVTSSLVLDLSQNSMNGSIPPSLFSQVSWTSSTPTVQMSMDYNKLSGTIPPGFFSSSLTQNTTFNQIALSFTDNLLEGSIPKTLLYSTSTVKRDLESETHTQARTEWTKQDFSRDVASALHSTASTTAIQHHALASLSLSLTFSGNRLNGTLPPTLISNSFSPSFISMSFLAFNVQSNRLTGELPTGFFDNLPSASGLKVYAYFDDNQFEGAVPPFCFTYGDLEFGISSNLLNGTLPDFEDCSIVSLNVGNNPSLSGSIPPSLLTSSSLRHLIASKTNLSGTVPTFASHSWTVDFTNSKSIDFCASNISFSSFTGTCALSDTQACECAASYAMCTVDCAAPTGTPPSPSSPSPSPSNPSPSSSPSSSTSGCSSPRPTPEFTCINGVWTASSTNVTILTIPANSGSLLITGNVSSSSIVFEGVIGTTITINGCANNLTTIVIQLSQEEILKIDKSGSKTFTLLTQSTNTSSSSEECRSFNNVVLASKNEGGCRKISTDKVVTNNGNTLSVAMSVDLSGCNRWWIILLSVVVVVVILGAVGIAVGVVLWKRQRMAKQKRTLSSIKPSLRG